MSSITINVMNSGTYDNGSNFSERLNPVSSGSNINLTAAGSSNIKVYTFQLHGDEWKEVDVFQNGDSPYKAKPLSEGGNPHTLKSSVTGMILLSLYKPPVVGGEYTSGTNGTINVGGGPDPDPDE
ncbi:MAG TPA: hypothetical protein VHN14_04330 [Kofleriaceae bacterium]|jgi:hypothetical protein|nr:hypothetical protein [Kofleriaceae bacterium]